MPEELNTPEVNVYSLLKSPIVTISDTKCRGTCRSLSTEEFTRTTQIIFPYRGLYVRHVGNEQIVADANQVLFFNREEGYRVSHPVKGGDGSLTLIVHEPQLRELAPADMFHRSSIVLFRQPRLRIDAYSQGLVALLRYRLHEPITEPLEAEVLALTLMQRTLGPRISRAPTGSVGSQKLVDRAKLVLSSDVMRRWTLAEVASEVRASPVYLTQVFQKVEGMPLYKYHLQLRLARALHLLMRYDDLSTLAMDLGFSNHSHLSATFRRVYGCSPSSFKRSVQMK